MIQCKGYLFFPQSDVTDNFLHCGNKCVYSRKSLYKNMQETCINSLIHKYFKQIHVYNKIFHYYNEIFNC